MKKLSHYILTVVFLVALILPPVIKVAGFWQDEMEGENRAKAVKPVANINKLDVYPAEFDAYYNDHFGIRSIGVKLYNDFNYFLLKKSPTPKKAILGKKGWLYQGRDIELYRGMKRLSEEELKVLEEEFKQRYKFLQSQNCELIFVVIPTKKEIYPEYLPDEYFRYSDKTATDQLVDLLKTNTKVKVLDLRPVLISAKKTHPVLYHKMDNHWNDIGTYYSYQSIINFMQQYAKVGEPRSFNEYKVDTTTYYGGSIAKMLGVQDEMIDYRIRLNPTFKNGVEALPQKYQSPKRFPYPGSYERRYQTNDENKPRLMMINDSFGEYLYRFMPEHFSYSLFLFDGWEFKLHAQKVLEEKPDIFVISMFEGFIENILNNLDREENKIPE